jgi:hypothetical protein
VASTIAAVHGSALWPEADIDRGLSILDASLLISNQLSFLVKSLRGSDFSRPVEMQSAVGVHRGNTDDPFADNPGRGRESALAQKFLTVDQEVGGSNPPSCTSKINILLETALAMKVSCPHCVRNRNAGRGFRFREALKLHIQARQRIAVRI